MITVDGSQGEGGGQVLRTSLALSMITGQSFRIDNIRAGRAKPGLLRQHLTSVMAAREVCGGGVTGAELGSTSLEFHPGAITPGDYSFSIGSAGSTTLVLQTVLPALMTAKAPSSVTISGGTHNTHAPTVRFLQHAFLPIVRRMGPAVQLQLERHGFYPAGGGRIAVDIRPTASLQRIDLTETFPVTARRATATVAGLPGTIAQRELAAIESRLGWPADCLKIEQLSGESGPGNVLSIEIERGDVAEVFTGFGERGLPAKKVAEAAIKDVQTYLAADVPVWQHLADQIMLPFALAGGGTYITTEPTLHTTTNAAVIESFLNVKVRVTEIEPSRFRVCVRS